MKGNEKLQRAPPPPRPPKKGSLLFKQCPVNSIIQQRAMVRQAREISQAKEERRNGTLKYETFRWRNTAEHNATKC